MSTTLLPWDEARPGYFLRKTPANTTAGIVSLVYPNDARPWYWAAFCPTGSEGAGEQRVATREEAEEMADAALRRMGYALT